MILLKEETKMAKVSLSNIDEWLFRGLGGIVNMLMSRIQRDWGFSQLCKQLLDHELKRLGEVKCEVDARQMSEYPTGEAQFSVLDTWFIRSYEGINSWLATRSAEGPPMDPSSIKSLEEHLKRLQEIVDHERGRQVPD